MKRLLLLTLFAFTFARATAAEPASIDTAIAKGDTAEVQRLLTAQPELVRTTRYPLPPTLTKPSSP